MTNAPVKCALRWMLAAWLLLATSVTSSTFVHSHTGGSVSHGHGRSHGAQSHSTTLDAHHGNREGVASVSAANVHRHGCLPLLGAVTCLPMPSQPTNSHERASADWETVFAAVGFRSAGVVLNHSMLARFGPLSGATISIAPPDDFKPRVIPCADIAPISLLCDRARHERSGVLLA